MDKSGGNKDKIIAGLKEAKEVPNAKDESLTSKSALHMPTMPTISKSTTSVDHPHPQVIEKPHINQPSKVEKTHVVMPHVNHPLVAPKVIPTKASPPPPKKPPLANEYPKMMYAARGERTSNISEGSPQFVNKIVNSREEEEVLVKSGWLFKPAGGV